MPASSGPVWSVCTGAESARSKVGGEGRGGRTWILMGKVTSAEWSVDAVQTRHLHL